jgi:hypothetical protein
MGLDAHDDEGRVVAVVRATAAADSGNETEAAVAATAAAA